MGLCIGLLFSPLLVLIWRKLRSSEGVPELRMSSKEKWGLFFQLPILYLFIYLLFGYYVAWQTEALRVFYNGEATLLPFGTHLSELIRNNFTLFPFQLFRGILWAGLVWLIVRLSTGKLFKKAFLAAALLMVPATLLLIPNPYMPEAVRLAHFWETLSSNILFGLLAGWYFAKEEISSIVIA